MTNPATLHIIDLLVDHLMHDECFPRMSQMAWLVKLRTLERPIDDLLDEVRREERADTEATIVNAMDAVTIEKAARRIIAQTFEQPRPGRQQKTD